MTEREFRFSVEGAVSGLVRGPSWLAGPVAFELAAHRTERRDDPDLIVDLALGDGLDDSGDTPLSWSGRHLVSSWQCRMSEPGQWPLRLRAACDRASRFIVSKWIVEPALRLAAEEKGALMCHAAALSDGNKAVLAAGPGGAGKTTWALRWIEAGHPASSDDFCLIRDGLVLPYLTPMRLGAGTILSSKVLADMPAPDKAEALARTLVRRLSMGRLKVYKKMGVRDAIPGVSISGPAKLAGAIWLGRDERPANGGDIPSAAAMAPAEMAALMAEVDRAEGHGFGEGDNGLPDDFLDGFRGRHRERTEAILSGLPCLALPARNLPRAESLASVDDLLDYLCRE